MLSLSLCLTLLPPETDQNDFTAFFDQYHRFVLYKAKEIVKSPEAAEDVAQEVFLYAARHFEKFRGRENRKATHYLILCTQSRAIDYIRKEDTAAYADLEAAEKEGVSIEDTERIVLRQETAARALAIVEALPAACRAAVLLRLDGMPYSEIAEMLNISRDAAYKRAQRGYAMVRERLVNEDGK